MIADESVTDNMISKMDAAEEGGKQQELEQEDSDDQASEGGEAQREPSEGPEEGETEEDQTEDDQQEEELQEPDEDASPAPGAVGSFNVDVFPKGGEGMAGDDSDPDSDPLSSGGDEDDDLDDGEDYMFSRHSIFNTFYDPLPVHRYVNLLGSESGQGRKLKRMEESGDSPPAKSRKVSDDQDSGSEDEMEEVEPGVRLCYAVEEGSMEEVVSITSAPNHDPAHLSTRLDPWERTPLMLACRNGNYQIVEHLLGCGASMTEVDGLSGSTSLHLCFSDARAPHLEAAKILLSKGSNVDCRNVKQSTPLMWAAMNSSNAWRPDSMAPVRFLVEEAKADLTLKNVNGLTARDIAMKHNWVECAEYLANQEDQEGAPTGPPAAGRATTEEAGAASPPPAAASAAPL